MSLIVPSNATKRSNDDTEHYGSYGNNNKKAKMEPFSSQQASKVVHLRSLPNDVTDSEVIQLGMTYGRVANILMLKGKNQAFLEMEDEEVAKNMVSSSETNPPTIRQRIIYIQFSNHKQLKTDTSPNQMRTQAVLQALQQTEGGVNHVLRAVVENMIYPITIDVLNTIFSKFGVVLKVITFNKSNQFQALIQMGDSMQTQKAKMSLDGQNIYNGCCTLRIEFSRLNCLNVKFNNDKSRDFTRSDLPTGNEVATNQSLLGNATSILQDTPSLMSNPYSATQQALASIISQSSLASMVQAGINSATNNTGSINMNQLTSQIASQLSNHSSFQGLNMGNNTQMNQNGHVVLHVSNLNEEKVKSPEQLFMLFGVYGDVQRVKILFQKKSSALVQIADSNQANQVRRHLHGVKFYGRPLNILISRHQQVQLPKDGLDVENLTKDYQNSPLHRFKKPGSKNFQNIFNPSSVLHLSNLPADVTEDDLREMFNEHGKVQGFKYFLHDKRMALIQMTDTDEALQCLTKLHNHKFGEKSYLRVSFSKGHL